MLFDKKNKGIIKAFWVVMSVIVIISMLALYIPLDY
jgi:hypothetical protein